LEALAAAQAVVVHRMVEVFPCLWQLARAVLVDRLVLLDHRLRLHRQSPVVAVVVDGAQQEEIVLLEQRRGQVAMLLR
jgi:hypothetical protein